MSEKPSPKTTSFLVIFSFFLLIILFPLVIYVIEASNFAGTLEKTQLGFDGDYIKENFELMDEDDMFFIILANFLDYLAMVAYGSFLFSSSLFLARKFSDDSFWRKTGFWSATFGLLSACFDAFENIFLLIMAFNPSSFPNWLAYPHSSFAFAKFTFLYASFGWIVLASFVLFISFIVKKTKNE